ncbi:MAG: NB-ARC domain-containing protein, partial [Anaerolineae bacterium]|nr:NB-ARC domain-containing protein [Anaerolineae bacterium]
MSISGSSTQASLASPEPRVFISYARSDGEGFAKALRQALERENIPLWQDRVAMEGGRDWWLQIEEALQKVDFMVLVMTPNALRSEIVRKEWRYARQNGVCVYPVKASPDLDFSALPRWMRTAHFYDLGYDPEALQRGPEWERFIAGLRGECREPRVPFMAADLPSDFVARPEEFEQIISSLLDERRENPVAITAALRGAGGYGKTTLALAVCHNERIQEAFDDGILWITLGESVTENDLLAKVETLIHALTGRNSGAPTLEGAAHKLREVLEERDILLVIDDVWRASHLEPFLQGGKRCARLITTRLSEILPENAIEIPVEALKDDEALKLLRAGLPEGEDAALRKLAERLHNWAQLIKLANGVLRERVKRYNQTLR